MLVGSRLHDVHGKEKNHPVLLDALPWCNVV
jgi:hypothetical protein